MKIVGITDSYPLHPRLIKICEYFKDGENDNICYISWNRTGKVKVNNNNNNNNNTFILNSNIGYGKKITKGLYMLKYLIFIQNRIKDLNPDMIICRHWQMFFIVSLLNNKKIKLIYDVCDMPNSKFIKYIEMKLIKKAYKIVLSSRYFEAYYNVENKIVLENRPRKKNVLIKDTKELYSVDYRNLRIGFVGKLRYQEIMKNLINAVKNKLNVELNFYGDGQDANNLKKYCEIEKINNVYFHGRYDNDELSLIYSKLDVVWAAYPYKLNNVKYAISNKYYETLAYKVPGIFSIETELGKHIDEKKIGFTVDPYSIEDISELIQEISENISLLEDIKVNLKIDKEPIFWEEYEEKKYE